MVLYATAIGLLALLWNQHRADGRHAPVPARPVDWTGQTDRGDGIEAVTTNGILVDLSVNLSDPCPGFTDRQVRWPEATAILRQDHGVAVGRLGPLQFTSDDDTWTADVTADLRVKMGDHPRGVIWLRFDGDPPSAGLGSCATGPLTFTLQRVVWDERPPG